MNWNSPAKAKIWWGVKTASKNKDLWCKEFSPKFNFKSMYGLALWRQLTSSCKRQAPQEFPAICIIALGDMRGKSSQFIISNISCLNASHIPNFSPCKLICFDHTWSCQLQVHEFGAKYTSCKCMLPSIATTGWIHLHWEYNFNSNTSNDSPDPDSCMDTSILFGYDNSFVDR